MKHWNRFNSAAYIHAEFLCQSSLEQVREGIAYFERYLPLDKVYLETHRGLYDVPEEKMREVRSLFDAAGISTSGGITSTVTITGHEKNSVFDVFCFTDPVYRERYMDIVAATARQFDEVILDDFFFTACRCEMCIKAKGTRSWAQFRLEQMESIARDITCLAHQTNPKCRMIVKYPNWYESYQECGYNPKAQKDIFDGIFTGTESRDPRYSPQHLQRYLSYGLLRLMENIAPGRNGGGWVDQGGSWDNLNVWLEQFYLTLLAGAKEIILFNFHELIGSPALPALGQQLVRIDRVLSETGNPEGVSLYEPYDADGEDQLMSYLGMLGIPLEPKPDFDANAPMQLLTASAACDEDVVGKLERYVREGGSAVITNGFLRATYDRGIREMTSVRLTARKASGREYWMDSYHLNHKSYCFGQDDVFIDVLEYKTNASWCEIALVSGDYSFPLLVDEFYGGGHLYILNIPDNFSDLYRLPKEIQGNINKVLARGGDVYLNAAPKNNLFLYDNGVFGVLCLRPHPEDMEIVLRGGRYAGIRDIETGEEFYPARWMPKPVKRFDSAKTDEDLPEAVVSVPITNGEYRFFRLIPATGQKTVKG